MSGDQLIRDRADLMGWRVSWPVLAVDLFCTVVLDSLYIWHRGDDTNGHPAATVSVFLPRRGHCLPSNMVAGHLLLLDPRGAAGMRLGTPKQDPPVAVDHLRRDRTVSADKQRLVYITKCRILFTLCMVYFT